MDLKPYIAPLLRWWWLILLAVALAAGSSWYVISQQPKVYTATSTLAVGRIIENPNPSATQINLGQQLAATYADIAERERVKDAVKETLGLNRLPQYRASLSSQNRLLIEIIVSDTDPERAAIVANTIANELIRQSPTGPTQLQEQQRREFVSRQLDTLQSQIDNTQAELTSQEVAFANAVSAQEIQGLRQDITALEGKLTSLQTNYANLLNGVESTSINTIDVLIPATPPTFPSGPRAQLTVVLSSLIGAALALTAAYLLSYLDDTIKSPADIEASTSLTTLAGVNKLRDKEQLVTVLAPRSPTAEAFRGLRTAAQFATVDSDEASFLITSSHPAEGKSTIAANFAVALAQAGYSTLLIDADLRRPTQHKVFELPNGNGLTRLLLDLSSGEDFDEQLDLLMTDYGEDYAEVPGLMVLTSGPIPPNPSELLGSAKMERLLKSFNERFDYVVIDTAPTLAVTDAIVLSNKVHGVIVVAEANRTRQPHIKQVVNHLDAVNGNILGVVLNRLSRNSGDYYYYYRYENSYYSDKDESSSGENNGKLNGKPRRGLRFPSRKIASSKS